MNDTSSPMQADIENGFKALDALVAPLVLGVLQSGGLFTQEGEARSQDSSLAAMKVVPARARLFAALLDIAVRAGHLQRDGQLLVATPLIEKAEVRRVLRDPVGAIAAFSQRHPDLGGFCDLLPHCVEGLAGVLAGTTRATDLLFPGGSMKYVEAIYKTNRLAGYFNGLAAHALRVQVQALLSADDAPPRLAIVEIGAGTGATTQAVLTTLAPWAGRVDYYFTDLSPGFLFKAKARFADHPNVAYKTLDLEKDLAPQGFAAGGFHAVLASNVVHATRDVLLSLQRVRSLLAQDGLLVLSEMTQGLDVLTLTFGLLDGWWLFEDPGRRMPHHPLLTPPAWRNVCEAAGFRTVSVTGSLPGHDLPQSLVVARP